MFPINFDTLEFISKRLLPDWKNLSVFITQGSVAFRADRDDLRRSVEVFYPMKAWTEPKYDPQTAASLVADRLNQVILDNQYR